MRLTRTTAWVGGTALLAVLVVVATWFLLVGPRQEEAAGLREQTASTASTNDLLAAQVRQLELQLGDVPATRAEVARLREQVPADTAPAALLRQLSALATDAGAELTAVTPTEPVADPAQVAAAAAPTPAPTSTGEATTDGTTDGTDAAATPAPTPAAPAVEVVPVTITAEGGFTQLQELLRRVQTEMPRAVLVRTVSLSAAEGQALTMSLTAEVFSLPTTDAEEQLAQVAAAAQAADPAAGGSPTATPVPSSAPSTGPSPTPSVTPSAVPVPIDAAAAAATTSTPSDRTEEAS